MLNLNNPKKIEKYIQSSQNKYMIETKNILEKYSNVLNVSDVVKYIKSANIIMDFDEIFIELIPSWLEDLKARGIINEKTNKPYEAEDITDFFIFDRIGEDGKKFLDDPFLYQTYSEIKDLFPEYERKFKTDISLRKDTLELLQFFKENDMLKNLTILTASASTTEKSKDDFIEKNLSEYIDKKQVIHTFDKASKVKELFEGNFNYTFFIDDAIHNHIGKNGVIEKNEYVNGFLLNHYHNLELETNKRIIRVDELSSKDFFFKLIYSAVKDLDRKINKSLDGEEINHELVNSISNMIKNENEAKLKNSLKIEDIRL